MHLGPHQHGHDCGHSQHDIKLNRSFAVAVILNTLLVAGEAFGGFISGSMALLADAGHNLGDVAGLILAWWAHWLRGKRTAGRWTYGLRSFTILAANVNGLLLVCTVIGIGLESTRRLFVPSEISELPVILVAAFAAALNFATAKLLSSGNHDLNVRGAYLHMLADAAVSLAVVIGALLIMATGWHWLDPAISIAICIVLGIGTWGLLKESTSMLMHAAPRQVELQELREFLLASPFVKEILDLHVWSVSTTDVLMTSRLLCPSLSAAQQDELLADLHASLGRDFHISHGTIEIVRSEVSKRECAFEN